ncbi:MAG: xylose isomerase, partial [Pseudomonadota bacterium]
RGLKAAASMLEDGQLEARRAARYVGWEHSNLLDSTLDSIAEEVAQNDINPSPRSGQQEILENIVNRFV